MKCQTIHFAKHTKIIKLCCLLKMSSVDFFISNELHNVKRCI